MNDFYDHISVDQYAIMPDHIHILLSVQLNQNVADEVFKTAIEDAGYQLAEIA